MGRDDGVRGGRDNKTSGEGKRLKSKGQKGTEGRQENKIRKKGDK